MTVSVEAIQRSICASLCADVRVVQQEGGLLYVGTPFTFGDGDAYAIYLEALPTGGFRITDLGGALMRLSYDNDLAKLKKGTRGRVFRQIVAEIGLQEEDGELYLDSPADQLDAGIFRIGQAITRVHELTFLNQVRVKSAFYEDLKRKLGACVHADSIHEHYLVPALVDAANYPVDFYVEGFARPLYLFGVATREKAMLTTTILQHLNAAKLDFRSMVVFQNSAEMPARDISRLMNAANDMISSLDADEAFERKLRAFV